MPKNFRNAVVGFGALVLSLPAKAAPATAKEAPAPIGPPSVLVTCGDTTIRIDGPKMWTMSLIQYKGEILGIEDSAYGSVFGFPDESLIGSAHWFKDESEQVKLLRFELDGKPLDSPPKKIKGRRFQLYKESAIRNLSVATNIDLRGNRIYETVIVRSTEATPLNLNYHFMHAWKPAMTDFIAAKDNGPEMGEELRDSADVERKFYINQPVDWIAVYDRKTHKGIVSRLLEQPYPSKAYSKLWNAPPSYRKYYYDAFPSDTLPAHFIGKYRMVTTFFVAKPEHWKDAARKVSRTLKDSR